MARVVRRGRHLEGDVTRDGVRRWRGDDLLGREARHVRQPAKDLLDAVLIVGGEQVRHAVGEHDLRPTQLVLGDVDLLAEQLVERREAREDDGPVGHLDDALRQPVDVGADADRAARDVRERERLVVRRRRLAGDEPGAAQVLDADAVLLADNVVELEALLARLVDVLSVEGAVGEPRHVLLGQVEVLVPVRLVGRVVPRDLEVGLELLRQADASARVGGDVQARDTRGARVLGDLVVKLVLLDAKGARLDGAVVGDDDEGATLRVLGRLERGVPADHADRVDADDPLAGRDGVAVLEQLAGDEQVGRHRGGRAGGDGALPLLHERLLEQAEEVVGVRGADAARDGALGGERRGDGVRLEVAHLLVGLALAEGAVGLRGARDRVEVLDVPVRLEPLPAHARRDEADGLPLAAADIGVAAHLDLVDAELQEARGVLGDENRHELLELGDDVGGRGAEGGENV